MAHEVIKTDANVRPVIAGITDDAAKEIVNIRVDPSTKILKVYISNPTIFEVAVSEGTDSILVYGFDGSVNQKLRTDADGHPQIDILSVAKTLKQACININAAGDNTIIASVAGKKLKIFGIVLVCTGAVAVTLKSATTLLTGAMSFSANGGYTQNVSPPCYLFETGTGEGFIINLGAGVQVSGMVSYFEE